MSQLPDNYIGTLARLKDQIQKARLKAALSANKVLLELYWEIGSAILEMQQAEGWGAKIIDRLSTDLKKQFPDFKGLSVRNLKYMTRFTKTFPHFGQQTVAQNQNPDPHSVTIGQQAAAQLPKTKKAKPDVSFVQPLAAQMQAAELESDIIKQPLVAKMKCAEKKVIKFVQGTLAQLSWYRRVTHLEKVERLEINGFWVAPKKTKPGSLNCFRDNRE
jgi:hypothetical protein